MIELLFLIIGFLFLIKGADWLVRGATVLAKNLKIKDIVIGLTVVAFGTSLPELFVNITASLSDKPDVVVGNILGSNNANILLILGAAAFIYPLKVRSSTVWKEIPFAVLASVIFVVLANDRILGGSQYDLISTSDGIILIFFFVIFLYYIFGLFQNAPQNGFTEEYKVEFGVKKSLLFIAAGLVGLVIGAKIVVTYAVILATQWGVSEALIGLTLVAVGTSLPELATSVVAAFRKNADIAVGNIVGSNIFNIFLIMGVSAILRPISFNSAFNKDAFIGVGTGLLMFVFMFTGKRKFFDRMEGLLFLIGYVFYVAYLIKMG